MPKTPKRDALVKRRAELFRQWTRQDQLLAQATARLAEAYARRETLTLHLKAIDRDLDQLVDTGWQHVEEAHEHEDSLR